MCSKPPKPKKVEEKPVQFLRNPFLDGVNLDGQDSGRNSLRIDRVPNAVLRQRNQEARREDRAAANSPQPAGIQPFAPGLFFPQRPRGGGSYQLF
jgi:hypothetical protein